MDSIEFLKARIEALETELEKVRQEKMLNELRFYNMNSTENIEITLKARIEALETELEKVRQEKTFLANELRF